MLCDDTEKYDFFLKPVAKALSLPWYQKMLPGKKYTTTIATICFFLESKLQLAACNFKAYHSPTKSPDIDTWKCNEREYEVMWRLASRQIARGLQLLYDLVFQFCIIGCSFEIYTKKTHILLSVYMFYGKIHYWESVMLIFIPQQKRWSMITNGTI